MINPQTTLTQFAEDDSIILVEFAEVGLVKWVCISLCSLMLFFPSTSH